MFKSVKKFFNRISKGEDVRPLIRVYGYSGGSFVSPDTAMKVSSYYRGVIYISTQVAKLNWVVKDLKNKTLWDSPITYLLNLTPNSEMSAFFFKLTMIQNAIHHGNSFAEIERDGIGRPVALWPINPENVELVRASNGKLFYRILGGATDGSGNDVYLQPKDVYHLKNFHTKDGLQGQGLVGYMSDTLGVSIGANKFANGLFENSAIPSGVIEVPGELSDEGYARLKESWKEQHSGKKVGGTALLEGGSKYNPISFDPETLQMLETRKFSNLEIARFLGLPPTKLFDTDASTYSNVENSNLEVATDTLDAWIRNMEMEADIKLLYSQHSGRRSEMDIYGVFRGDMATRSDYFSKRMQMGTITPNQVRMAEGEEPYEGGDRYFIAVNNYSPSDRIDEIIDAKINPPKAEKSSEPEEKKEDDTEELDKEVTKAAAEYLRRKTE